jgi:hypothetical protein
MAIIIILAQNKNERLAAHQIVKNTYIQSFNVDIDELYHLHPEQFESDVLLAYSNETCQYLGTMSIMFPNNLGQFPCESLFGFNLSNLELVQKKYIEVGRFATTEEGKKNPAVVIALFLGAIKLLEIKQINGWTATVKNDVYDFLQKIALPVHNIAQTPILQEKDPLNAYVGNQNDIHLFDVSLTETAISFGRFQGYLTREKVKLAFA